MKASLRRLFWKVLGNPGAHPGIAQKLAAEHPSLIAKAARFVACEMVEGDYLEFGVYRGKSFAAAYQSLSQAFEDRITQDAGGASEEQREARRRIWANMKFCAFDSFEGLPELQGIDRETKDFAAGQYAAAEDEFVRNVVAAGAPRERIVTVPGWFKDTANPAVLSQHGITKASIVWIDGDLYESARDALHGITPLLQDGTVLIFDDWYAFRGNPDLGEQRAYREWSQSVPGFVFNEFHKEGTWRNSFIACKKGG